MNGFSIFIFVIGVINLIIGYMRRFKGKVPIIYPKFKDESHKRIYYKLRGNFDICYGTLMVVASLFNQLLEPNLSIFVGGLFFIITIAFIIFHFIKKKYDVHYL